MMMINPAFVVVHGGGGGEDEGGMTFINSLLNKMFSKRDTQSFEGIMIGDHPVGVTVQSKGYVVR